MQLVNGTALTGRLMKSADDLGVDIRVSTPATRLLTDGTGTVSGALVDSPEGTLAINASRGVVLATGGFPHDIATTQRTVPQNPYRPRALDAGAQLKPTATASRLASPSAPGSKPM